jgi:periplasmic protein TonB
MALPKRGKIPDEDLRLKYPKVIEISLIITIAVFILAFRFLPEWEGPDGIAVVDQELVDIEDIDVTRQEERPPPPPRPPIPIETPGDEIMDDLDFAWSELDMYEDVPPPPPPKDDEEMEEFFVAVEEMPEIVGGIASIQRRVVYPELAKRAGVEGTVYVYAFVDAQGRVVRTEVVNDPGAGLGDAAAKAVAEAEFKPGRQRGQPVGVRVSIPVHFRLTR